MPLASPQAHHVREALGENVFEGRLARVAIVIVTWVAMEFDGDRGRVRESQLLIARPGHGAFVDDQHFRKARRNRGRKALNYGSNGFGAITVEEAQNRGARRTVYFVTLIAHIHGVSRTHFGNQGVQCSPLRAREYPTESFDTSNVSG